WPRGTGRTQIAKASGSAGPQATIRQLIARRLRDSAMPIPRIRTIPNRPVSRWPTERGAAWVTGGATMDGETTDSGAGCGRTAPRRLFQANRGSVNTASAHTNVTAHASTVRRKDI